MKGTAFIVLGLTLLCLVVPAPSLADGQSTERYSYITVKDMTIRLEKDDAVISVNYSIDPSTNLIVLLLGKTDLKNKLLRVLNYEEATVRSIDLDSAEIVVTNTAYDYGRGIHWFPEHQFGVMIPLLRVISPQVTREYTMTSEFPNGIGYFDP
jgi:hypothetical protein